MLYPTTPQQRSSVADLEMPLWPAPQAADPDTLRRLRELSKVIGSDKHSGVVVLIEACIDGGIDAGPDIIAAIYSFGFNKRHIGMMLKENTGNDPERHRWNKDEDGRYRLLA